MATHCYLLVHVSFPTQRDGDPVEFNVPIRVYLDPTQAKQACDKANMDDLADQSDADEYDDDYDEPYYSVLELDLIGQTP